VFGRDLWDDPSSDDFTISVVPLLFAKQTPYFIRAKLLAFHIETINALGLNIKLLDSEADHRDPLFSLSQKITYKGSILRSKAYTSFNRKD